MQKMLSTIRIHATNISAKAGSLYRRALDYAGLQDTTETRITAAAVVSVALFYICAGIQAIADLLSAAAGPMLTALLSAH